VFLGLAWLPTLISAAVFIIVLGIFRISSVASLSAAITLPIALLVSVGPQSPLFMMSLAVLALVIWTHRSNIRRLRRGEEPRIGRKAEVSAQ
jgi:glycerol-3-phosphate acyltransferase PlsY